MNKKGIIGNEGPHIYWGMIISGIIVFAIVAFLIFSLIFQEPITVFNTNINPFSQAGIIKHVQMNFSQVNFSQTIFIYNTNYTNLNFTIVSNNQNGYNYSMTNAPYNVFFKKNSRTSNAVMFVKNGYQITQDISTSQLHWYNSSLNAIVGMLQEMNPQNTNATISGVNGNMLNYPNAWINTNLSYTLTNNGLKENLIIANVSKPTATADYLQYVSNINFNNTMYICNDTNCYLHPSSQTIISNGSIYFKDVNNNTIFTLPIPYITDSVNNTVLGYYSVSANNGIAVVNIRIPKSFIDVATYPLYFDPTVSAPSLLAIANLITPQNNLVMRGSNRLVAEFNLINYNSYLAPVGNLSFYDLANNSQTINRVFTYKILQQNGTYSIPTYTTNCSTIVNGSNSNYLSCVQIQNGTIIQSRYDWFNFSNQGILGSGNMTIGVFTNVLSGDNVEWIPSLYGMNVTQWASWNDSMNVGITNVYPFNNLSDSLHNIDFVAEGAIPVFNNTFCIYGNCAHYSLGDGSGLVTNQTFFDLSNPSSKTMNFWYDRVDDSYDTHTYLFLWQGDGGGYIYLEGAGAKFSYGSLCGGGASNIVPNPTGMNMITIVRNATASYCYVNGQFDKSGAASSPSYGVFHIPHASDKTGTVDELYAWNRTLSADEIGALYDGGTGIFYQPSAPSDTVFPQFSNYADDNGTKYATQSGNFNVTVTSTNGTVFLNFGGVKYTATNVSGNSTTFNATISSLPAAGTYTYNWTSYGNGTLMNSNVSNIQSYTVIQDTLIPQFSNYTDNNGTQMVGGTGTFNVGILNTNGTAILEFNGVNYTVPTASSPCYQESANVSTACGGLNTGSYTIDQFWDVGLTATNVIDGNWTSFGAGDNTGDVIITYTKPIGSINSGTLWEVKDAGGIFNLSIPTGCWNYDTNTLQLKVRSRFADWYCRNASGINGFENLREYISNQDVYEEAMIWSITTNATVFPLPAAGTYSYKWDSWGNGPGMIFNVSNIQSYTIIPDTIYPQFSNYQDNNGTQAAGGNGLFNVSIGNTNGTIVFNFAGTNYSFSSSSNATTFVNYNANFTNAPPFPKFLSDPYVFNYNSLGYYAFANEIFGINYMPNDVGNITFRFNAYNFHNITAYINTSSSASPPGGNTSLFYSFDNVNWNMLNSTTSTNKIIGGKIPDTTSSTLYVEIVSDTFLGTTENPVTRIEVNYTTINFNGTITLPSQGLYNYNWMSWGAGPAHNFNISNAQSYTVLSPPNIKIQYPANNTNSSNSNLNINYTVAVSQFGANIGSCWFNNDSNPVNISLPNCQTNITNYIWIDGHHNVTVYANDTFGNTNSSSVFFFIHTGIPIITIATPQNITYVLPYSTNASQTTTVGLNYTINEPFEDSCWYSINNGVTNISLTNCNTNATIGGIPYGSTTFTLYANDSFNNENGSSVTAQYQPIILQKSIIWNVNTAVGAPETFTINATIFNSVAYFGTVANLVYNGTNYTATTSNSGDNRIFTSTITIPFPGNESFYFIIGLVNASGTFYYNSTTNYQNVSAVTIANCSTNPFLNLSIADEDTQALIPGTIEIALNLYTFGTNNLINTFNSSLNYNGIDAVPVCLSNNNFNYSYSYVIKYYGNLSSYYQQYKTIQYGLINPNVTQSITLYDLLIASGSIYTISVRGASSISNLLVDIQRQYIPSNNFKSVESSVTDINGNTIAHLVPGTVVYNFLITRYGVPIAVFNNNFASTTNNNIILSLTKASAGIQDFSNYGNISSVYFWDNNTRVLSYTYTATDGNVHTLTQTVTQGGNQVCYNTQVGTSGTIFCPIPINYGNDTLFSSIVSDGNLISGQSLPIGQTPGDVFGGTRIILQLMLYVSLVMLFLANPVLIIVGSILGMTLGAGLFLIGGTTLVNVLLVFGWFIAAAIIIAWQIGRRQG